MKMVCAHCHVELRIKKNWVIVVTMFQDPPEPYQVHEADLWQCPICQIEIATGFGQKALAEHFEPDKIKRWLDFADERGLRIDNFENLDGRRKSYAGK